VGICILLFATNQKHLGLPVIDRRRLGQDQSWFLMIFAGIALLGCLAFPGKFLLGFIPLAIYIFYCYRQMDGLVTTGTIILERLFICPKQPNPPTSLVLLQTGLGLCFICLGSQLFISCMEAISTALGAQPHVIALLLSPIATELPEIMNTFIWIRKGKVALALGNISGSMMAQATVPSALGILFTPWLFDYSLGLAVVATMASILFLRLTLSHRQLSAKKLVWAALFYFIFCGLIFIAH
jgi:cation:H+ antiporter